MGLQDAGATVRYLVRDRDAKFPALFDEVLRDAGTAVLLTGIRMPRMNAIMERWVRTCRHELLERTLIWNHARLLHALREFEAHYNEQRPQPVPDPNRQTPRGERGPSHSYRLRRRPARIPRLHGQRHPPKHHFDL